MSDTETQTRSGACAGEGIFSGPATITPAGQTHRARWGWHYICDGNACACRCHSPLGRFLHGSRYLWTFTTARPVDAR